MKLTDVSTANKVLILGTALWGWGIDRTTAYQLLERFLSLGGRFVDTATNYPINKQAKDFGLAASWLADWLKTHKMSELSIGLKVGSKDNMGGAAIDLSAVNIHRSVDFYRASFGDNLGAVAVHWDNRGDAEQDVDAIAETVAALVELETSGLAIGFSGVRRPDLYWQAAPELSHKWWIQVKENILTHAARLSYAELFPQARYIAYGINMGGLKEAAPVGDSSMALRGIDYPATLVKQLSTLMTGDQGLIPAPTTLSELALLSSYWNPALSGLVIGPRNVKQLEDTLLYWTRIKTEATPSVRQTLMDLQLLSDLSFNPEK